MAKRKAVLYSYSEDVNYEIEIEESIDLNAEDFDWEEVLLHPIEEIEGKIDSGNGVIWAWAN